MTVNNDVLQHYATNIRRNGPDRVVVDAEGHAVSPRIAKRDYGRTRLDVIFIRHDGWSVGASKDLASVAERLWRSHWVGVLRPPATRAEPYTPEVPHV